MRRARAQMPPPATRGLAGLLMCLVLCLALPFAAAAQDSAQQRAQTLADIRQEMSALFVEVQRLRTELSTTGLPQAGIAGTSALERVDAIEQALQRLTARTEELEFRIDRIVTDGTNRLADLEFRLVELEGGDVSQLSQTTTLGGGAAPAAPAQPVPPATGGEAELALGERADFERAREALASGSFRSAADLLAAFAETYPGGALSHEAHFLRGEALRALGETAAAARAYLDSFSGAPGGARAPDALLQLGRSLGDLGQAQEACLTLGEVGLRFPQHPAAAEAATARQAFSCL